MGLITTPKLQSKKVHKYIAELARKQGQNIKPLRKSMRNEMYPQHV